MSSTHVHTDMDVHYQTASKVMCTHALCVAFFFFFQKCRKIFWAKCGKFMQHVEKTTQKNCLKSQHGQQLVGNNSKKKMDICLLLTFSSALDRVARWCPRPV